MSTLADLEKRLAATRRAERKAEDDVDAARRRKFVLCHHCGARSRIGKVTYIQCHYYVEPYSCMEGDYWKPGEGRFLCEKCGYENRLIYRPDVEKLKPYFGETEDRHERHEGPPGSRAARKSVN